MHWSATLRDTPTRDLGSLEYATDGTNHCTSEMVTAVPSRQRRRRAAQAWPLLAIVLFLALIVQQLQHFPYSSIEKDAENIIASLLLRIPNGTLSSGVVVATSGAAAAAAAARPIENERFIPNRNDNLEGKDSDKDDDNDDDDNDDDDDDDDDNDDDNNDDNHDDNNDDDDENDDDENDDDDDDDDNDDDDNDDDDNDDDNNDNDDSSIASFTQADADLILQRVETSERYLEAYDGSYYVYEQEEMRKPKIRDEVLRGVCEPEYTQFLRDAIPEIEMLMAMENHPLRTKNTEDAKQFIVPIPIGAIMIHKRHSRNQFEYPSAMNALFQQPTFQKMQGHNHVLISQAIPPFSAMRKHVRAMSVHRLTQFYPQLANVTVAQEMNRRGCAQLLQQRNISSTGAFISMCNTVVDRLQYATTRKTFSINFVPQSSMPYQEASYGNWLSKELFIFYQTTFKPSFNGSTKYRRAPLDPKVVRHLPKSSIGYGVSKKEWLKGMTSAKFCLAVRGDNPLSHAFLNAVKAGCLPVIVSDVIPLFAPPFMSSIDIHDYTIFIREKDFIDNTLHELRKLQRMSDLELRTKLRALALAQRVIAPDHPRSLFVPAFLREAALAEPSPTIFEVLDSGNHTLQNVRYVRARTGK